MVRKYIMAAGIILLGLSLAACRKDGSRVSQGHTNEAQTTREDTSQASAQDKSSAKEQDDTENADNTNTTSAGKPAASIKPDIKSGRMDKSDKMDKTNKENATNKTNKTNDTEGEAMEANGQSTSARFYYERITDEIKSRIVGKSYGKDCDVPFDELRYVRVLYWGFDDRTHNGELIVNKSIAEDIVVIFEELYQQKYPIERMVLVDEYDADDNASMGADNTSAFNYRNVDGTNNLSLHSYGLAIDINPLYNPYVRGTGDNQVITPVNGRKYADRSLDCAYYIRRGDICYKTFIKHGFIWGGEWTTEKDYQHFEKEPE